MSALRPYPAERPTRIYGDLTDMDHEYAMKFICPQGSAPQSIEERVVLHGTLTIEKARHRSGYELVLHGSKVGNWTPTAALSESDIIPKVDRPKVSLERFVSTGSSKRLVFIGTERALRDAESTFRKQSTAAFPSFVRTASFEQMQGTILELQSGADAFCLLRGGGDPNSFVLWNDTRLIALLLKTNKPFYTLHRIKNENGVEPPAITLRIISDCLSVGKAAGC